MTENLACEPILEHPHDVQKQLVEQRQKISSTSVEGSAGGGAVKVSMRADGTVLGVTIDADVVSSGDVTMLEDLVTAAFRDALKECGNAQAASIVRLDGPTSPGRGG
ncbi:MAG: YbaB/EbfC family nucleoid-associated protein [Acidimicrobiales bacterium]|nr:YbaB/EbfC family nucleoid-associated protein [Acidimicrobiales bacterium]MEC8829412.1 YbaB/EbfC family nucleoid-associated protein [Actinomycetota bacterium]